MPLFSACGLSQQSLAAFALWTCQAPRDVLHILGLLKQGMKPTQEAGYLCGHWIVPELHLAESVSPPVFKAHSDGYVSHCPNLIEV